MNNQAVAQISRIEDYLKGQEDRAHMADDFDRERACFQSLLIIRLVCGDERYTLESIMEVE